VMESELAKYGGLQDRPRLVALNKADLPDGRDMADIVTAEIAERGWPVFQISALTHHGLKELTFAMAELVAKSRTERVVEQAERIVIRPKPKGSGDEFTITETTDSTTERGRRSWRVRGIKPERWIRQTDFSNDEAVGFLGDRLNRIGVEKQLLERGACEGDDVLIGHPDNSVVFDFKPGMDAGAAEMLGRRGEDQRFTEDRPAAGRRRAIATTRPAPMWLADWMLSMRTRATSPPNWTLMAPRWSSSTTTSTRCTPARTDEPGTGHRGQAGRGQGGVVLTDDCCRGH
jgi:GTP-binding protein